MSASKTTPKNVSFLVGAHDEDSGRGVIAVSCIISADEINKKGYIIHQSKNVSSRNGNKSYSPVL